MAQVTDDLDDLLGFVSGEAPSAKSDPKDPILDAPAVAEPEPIEEPEPEEDSEEFEISSESPPPEFVLTEKPKRARRTKAQIAADSAIAAVGTMSEEEAQNAYLSELQARLRGTTSAAPRAENSLTPLERQIRQAEDALATKTVQSIDTAETRYETSIAEGEIILIHIVNDGLVINGQPVYRGQEFRFGIGGQAYEQTRDRNGKSFLSLAEDIDAQYEKWGEQKIGAGPWRGKRSDYTLKDAPTDFSATEKGQWLLDMNAHTAAEARRAQAAPVMTALF